MGSSREREYGEPGVPFSLCYLLCDLEQPSLFGPQFPHLFKEGAGPLQLWALGALTVSFQWPNPARRGRALKGDDLASSMMGTGLSREVQGAWYITTLNPRSHWSFLRKKFHKEIIQESQIIGGRDQFGAQENASLWPRAQGPGSTLWAVACSQSTLSFSILQHFHGLSLYENLCDYGMNVHLWSSRVWALWKRGPDLLCSPFVPSPSTAPGILCALDKHLLDDEWMNCPRMVSTAETQPNLLSSPRAPKEANDGGVGSKRDRAKKQARNWKVHSLPGC